MEVGEAENVDMQGGEVDKEFEIKSRGSRHRSRH